MYHWCDGYHVRDGDVLTPTAILPRMPRAYIISGISHRHLVKGDTCITGAMDIMCETAVATVPVATV